jgi:chorismate mutase/prephenate dehydratase
VVEEKFMGQEEKAQSTLPANEIVCDVEPDIYDLRNSIDVIDKKILQLINRRLILAQKIGGKKKQSGSQVVDSKRESEILNRLASLNKGPLNPNVLKHIFINIIAAARALQQSQRVAFLGPKATFTHIAGMHHFGYSVSYVSQPTIRDLFSEVEKGVCHYGVVPVENSVEGSVRHTLDLFFESDLKICAERYQAVSYDLISKNDNLKAIEIIYAHPQAIIQCRNWLRQHLPVASVKECGSSDQAIHKVLKNKRAAAVAGSDTATMFGLKTVTAKIEDFSGSATRFLVIGKEDVRPTGKDKTSLMFALSHTPGALSQVLAPFAGRKINLVKIESRPTKHESWSHFFFVDVEGHMQDHNIKEIVEQIKPLCLYFKWLGSYPLFSGKP